MTCNFTIIGIDILDIVIVVDSNFRSASLLFTDGQIDLILDSLQIKLRVSVFYDAGVIGIWCLN
jgi:hypothetical protein